MTVAIAVLVPVAFGVTGFLAYDLSNSRSGDNKVVPGDRAGARAMLAKFLEPGADRQALTEALRPTTADYQALFSPDFASQAEQFYDRIWNLPGQTTISPQPNQTDIILASTPSQDLRGVFMVAGPKADTGDVLLLDLRSASRRSIKPGLDWYEYKFVAPGMAKGLGSSGLIFINGHWRIFPMWPLSENELNASDPKPDSNPKNGSTDPIAPSRSGQNASRRESDSPKQRPVIVRPPGSLQVFNTDLGSIWAMTFSPDGKKLLTSVGGTKTMQIDAAGNTRSTAGNCAILWDVATGQKLWETASRENDVRSAAFVSEKYVVTTSDDPSADLWNSANGRSFRSLNDVFSAKTAQRALPRGRSFNEPASGGEYQSRAQAELDRATGFGGASRGSQRTRLSFSSVSVDSNTALVLTSTSNGMATLWQPDVRNGDFTSVGSFEIEGDGVLPVRIRDFAAATSRNKVLIVDSYSESAKLFDVSNGNELWKFPRDSKDARSVALSASNGKAAIALDDKTIAIVDVATGNPLWILQGHTADVNDVAFSPDSTRVLTASSDKTAILWEAASGEKIETFAGHATGISSVAFNSDGTKAVTGSFDGTAFLWEVRQVKTTAVESQPIATTPSQSANPSATAPDRSDKAPNPFQEGTTWTGMSLQLSDSGTNPRQNNGARFEVELTITRQDDDQFEGMIHNPYVTDAQGKRVRWGATASAQGKFRDGKVTIDSKPDYVPEGTVLVPGTWTGTVSAGVFTGEFRGSSNSRSEFSLQKRPEAQARREATPGEFDVVGTWQGSSMTFQLTKQKNTVRGVYDRRVQNPQGRVTGHVEGDKLILRYYTPQGDGYMEWTKIDDNTARVRWRYEKTPAGNWDAEYTVKRRKESKE